MIPQDMKAWIDRASYEELLRRWRFAPVGDPWFQGEVGEYYAKVMKQQRMAEDVAETMMDGTQSSTHVRASKNIGWEK